MYLRFAKMHGLGNDFMVVEWPADRPDPSPEQVRAWADRRLGVGFDQLLLVSADPTGRAAAAYRIFNCDGGEVEQCGNGARCIARYVASYAEATRAEVRDGRLLLSSAAGPIEAEVTPEAVSVNLGVPNFEPRKLPFHEPVERERYRRHLVGGEVEFGAVSLGNPHAVIPVDSVARADVGILGRELATHRDFPQGVNVGFVEFVDPRRVRLRVFERGAGETPACGTGAAAAVAVGRRWGRLADEVEVTLTGGRLKVRWSGPGEPLWQTGPATLVYEGRIEL